VWSEEAVTYFNVLAQQSLEINHDKLGESCLGPSAEPAYRGRSVNDSVSILDAESEGHRRGLMLLGKNNGHRGGILEFAASRFKVENSRHLTLQLQLVN
jgi:hypothetical protein